MALRYSRSATSCLRRALSPQLQTSEARRSTTSHHRLLCTAQASSPAPHAAPSASEHASSRAADTEQKTHFGYKDVPLRDKQGMVSSVFSSVASNYDVMNDLMSARVHRLWKDAFVRAMDPTPDLKILDVAAGTADISLRVAQSVAADGGWTSGGLTVTDVNGDMLSVAEQRLRAASAPGPARDARCVVANAEALPFADAVFDVYAISFGMRNVPRPRVALREAFRVLRPGGRFMMLEFAGVSNPLVSRLYDAWSFTAIPAIGAAVANDAPAYRYLVESIRRFPRQAEFVSMMRDAGFVEATATDYTFGVAACYSAFKPVPRVG